MKYLSEPCSTYYSKLPLRALLHVRPVYKPPHTKDCSTRSPAGGARATGRFVRIEKMTPEPIEAIPLRFQTRQTSCPRKENEMRMSNVMSPKRGE